MRSGHAVRLTCDAGCMVVDPLSLSARLDMFA